MRKSKSHPSVVKNFGEAGKTERARAAPVKSPPAAEGKTGGRSLQLGSYFPARHTRSKRMFFLVIRPAVLGEGV